MVKFNNIISAGFVKGSGFVKSAGFVKGAGFVNRFYSTKRLTIAERNSFSVTPYLHEVIIGSCLGDLYANKQCNRNYARLTFKQGLINEAYILHLYDLFKDYCGTGPLNSALKPDKRTGKVYTSIRFSTYSLPCFNYYHDLFYVNGVKRIPLSIGDLLTPVSLAYWAMDDGCKKNTGFTFCTDSYTFEETEFLCDVLRTKFGLICSSHKNRKTFRIFISSKSMDKFRSLVTPYFHESMMYKLTT